MNNLQPEPAQVSGEACVIRAKPATLTAQVTVTRATGEVEHYTLTAEAPEQPEEP